MGTSINGASGGGAPSGAAGGDLGGTYPDPTVTGGTHHTHTASQVSDSSSSGRSVLTGTPAQGLAALYPSVAISLASSSGWSTTSSAGCAATINTSSEQIDLSLPAAAGTFTNASGYRLPPALGVYELVARLRTHSGATASTDVAQMIAYGPSLASYAYVNVRGDDTVLLGDDAGSTTAVSVASIRGGQGWVRLRFVGATVVAFAGVGSAGAQPTTWTPIGSVSRTGAYDGYNASLRFGATRGGSVSGTLAVSWGDISYRDLAP